MGGFLSKHKGAADTADFITIQTRDLNRFSNRIDFPSKSTHNVG